MAEIVIIFVIVIGIVIFFAMNEDEGEDEGDEEINDVNKLLSEFYEVQSMIEEDGGGDQIDSVEGSEDERDFPKDTENELISRLNGLDSKLHSEIDSIMPKNPSQIRSEIANMKEQVKDFNKAIRQVKIRISMLKSILTQLRSRRKIVKAQIKVMKMSLRENRLSGHEDNFFIRVLDRFFQIFKRKD